MHQSRVQGSFPIATLKFPAILCKKFTLVVIRSDFLGGIGSLSSDHRRIEINVARDSDRSLRWILGHDGCIPANTFDILPAPWVAMRTPAVMRRISKPEDRPVSPINFVSIASPFVATNYALKPGAGKVLTRRLGETNYTFNPTSDPRMP